MSGLCVFFLLIPEEKPEVSVQQHMVETLIISMSFSVIFILYHYIYLFLCHLILFIFHITCVIYYNYLLF